jgi:hypothetical protein
MTTKLNGHHFNSAEEIQQETMAALSNNPESQQCFETWIKQWIGCISHGEDYFETGHTYFILFYQ